MDKPQAKACAVNPLKLSPSLGGAAAFLGLDGCMPMLHGAQGCTSLGLVVLVRHFREAIPFQTTAMNEVTTILGGRDNLEQAILNIATRAKPKVIGICSTGLTETRGEDVKGDLKLIRAAHPELADTALVFAATPDYIGAFEDGWRITLEAIVDSLVDVAPTRDARQINILAGSHLTPADIEEIRDSCEAFGFSPIVLPDISGSLDGHVADVFKGTTYGGTSLADIRAMGCSVATLAIGRQCEKAARLLEARCHVPAHILPRLTGLTECDAFITALMKISGRAVPERIKRQRSRLVDAMLDGHFYFGNLRVAVAADPDLAASYSHFLLSMGAKLDSIVTTNASEALQEMPGDIVRVGDLDDLEQSAQDCDLILANCQAARLAERLHRPLYRIGMPVFDRMGNAAKLSVGYRGTAARIFDIANIVLAQGHDTHAKSGGGHAALAAC